mmetsp:Transcript_12777/g.35296  ORF Transcript_12777/g.35296 Transcript_12777/m.35296 type:complete len:139 (-) Transcript_12777:562-978(-)
MMRLSLVSWPMGAQQFNRSILPLRAWSAPLPTTNRGKLNDAYFIDQPTPNIIYTFDYFFPDVFCQESDGGRYSYPSSMPCDVVFQGWTQIFCPTNRSQVFDVNKDLLESVLLNYPPRVLPPPQRACPQQPIRGEEGCR